MKQVRIGQMASKKSCLMLRREILISSLRKKPSIFSMQDFKSVLLTLSSTRIHLLSFQLYWRIRERKNLRQFMSNQQNWLEKTLLSSQEKPLNLEAEVLNLCQNLNLLLILSKESLTSRKSNLRRRTKKMLIWVKSLNRVAMSPRLDAALKSLSKLCTASRWRRLTMMSKSRQSESLSSQTNSSGRTWLEKSKDTICLKVNLRK